MTGTLQHAQPLRVDTLDDAKRLVERYGLPRLKAMMEKAEQAQSSHGTIEGAKYFAKKSVKLVVEEAFKAGVGAGASAVGSQVAKLRVDASFLSEPLSKLPQTAAEKPIDFVGGKIGDKASEAGYHAGYDRSYGGAEARLGPAEDARAFRAEAEAKVEELVLAPLAVPKGMRASDAAHDFKKREGYGELTKEVVHQIDMLCRAWDELWAAIGSKKPASCQGASTVAMSLYFFQRKYNKLRMFCAQMLEDYVYTGAAFKQAGRTWDATGPRLLGDALFMLTWRGLVEERAGVAAGSQTLRLVEQAAREIALSSFRMPTAAEFKNYRA